MCAVAYLCRIFTDLTGDPEVAAEIVDVDDRAPETAEEIKEIFDWSPHCLIFYLFLYRYELGN